MRYYFTGVSQSEIAGKAGVDQSTVSIYSSRFKEVAVQAGLSAAAKEFKIFDEVDSLRSLSVELLKTNLTVEDAKQGMKIMKSFMKLGIPPEQHSVLIKICRNVNDPAFIHAALKLAKIVSKRGISYVEALFKFEKVSSELPVVEKTLKETQAKLRSFTNSPSEKQREVAKCNAQLEELQKQNETKRAKLKQELENEMHELEVRSKEVKGVALPKERLNL